MISKTSEYALRAVLHLAEQQDDAPPVPAAEIAEALDVPPNYLSKILHTLTRVGILRSERGPRGGFKLGRAADALPLADLIEPFDQLARRRSCLLGRPECSDESPCRMHDRWKEVSQPVLDFFHQTMVADLVRTGVIPRAGAVEKGDSEMELDVT